METVICDNDEELISAINEFLIVIISQKISHKETFSVGLSDKVTIIHLSGGSIIELLSKVFLNLSEQIYKHIHFFFCDERFVDDKSSKDFTFNEYDEKLFSKRSTARENIHKINLDLNFLEATDDYKVNIQNYFQSKSSCEKDIPKFDALFLGIGPDGHTASLFPNHRLLKGSDCIIASLDDSPKPPSKRITMTFPLINSAHNICIVAVGESKASIVQKCINDFKLGGNENYPVSLVDPYHGRLVWFLNKGSAKLFNELKDIVD